MSTSEFVEYEFSIGLFGLNERICAVDFLNYHHLRYFWMVAKTGGLTRAAVRLNVSQSTISAQIHELEDTLGEKLFRRTGRSIELTDAGQHALAYAEEIFAIGEDLLDSMKQRPASRPLRLRLGVADALPKVVVYQIIKPVFQLATPVQLFCVEMEVSDMLRQLASYQLDAVLADEPSSNDTLLNHLLGQCGVTFCAAPELAARLRRGFPESLDKAPALLPLPQSGLRRSLEKWFHLVGVRPRLVGEFQDSATASFLTLYKLGFTAVPTIASGEINSRFGLCTVGQTDECKQNFYAITSQRKMPHPAVQAIIRTDETSLNVK